MGTSLNKWKQFLEEISFTGRCESTLSYTSLKNTSKYRFRHEVKKNFFYLLNFLAPNDVQTVWNDVVGNFLIN
jgi:hypothetical protein